MSTSARNETNETNEIMNLNVTAGWIDTCCLKLLISHMIIMRLMLLSDDRHEFPFVVKAS